MLFMIFLAVFNLSSLSFQPLRCLSPARSPSARLLAGGKRMAALGVVALAALGAKVRSMAAGRSQKCLRREETSRCLRGLKASYYYGIGILVRFYGMLDSGSSQILVRRLDLKNWRAYGSIRTF